MVTSKVPNLPPDTGPAIEYLLDNDCPIPIDATWNDILIHLDACNLWAGVGDVFRDAGLVHSFDPTTIPLQIKQELDYYKEQITLGERDLTCEEAAQILEKHGEELCISQYGETMETYELTAEESLQNCMNNSGLIGTCSEIAMRYASEFLYLNPECSLSIALWPSHIEAFGAGLETSTLIFSEIQLGDASGPFGASELFVGYYTEDFKRLGDVNAVYSFDDIAFNYQNPAVSSYVYSLAVAQISILDLIENHYSGLTGALNYSTSALEDGRYEKEVVYLKAQLEFHAAFAEGDFGKLEVLAKRLLTIDPWNSDAYKYLSSATFYLYGDYAGAETLMQKAFDLLPMQKREDSTVKKAFSDDLKLLDADVPKNVGAALIGINFLPPPFQNNEWLRLGMLYLELGDLVKSKEALMKALELDPTNKLAAERLVKIGLYESEDDQQKRLAWLIEFVKRFPNSPPLNMFVIHYYSQEDMYEEIKKISERLVKSEDPKLKAVGYYGLGIFEEDLVEEIRLYEEARRLDPGFTEAYLELADSKRLLGDFEGALGSIQEVRKLDPLDDEAYKILGEIYYDMGNLNDAEKWLFLAARLGGGSLDLAIDFSVLYYARGDLTIAEDFLREVLETDPNNSGALLYMAAIRREQDSDEYKEYLERYMKVGGFGAEYYYVLGRIAELDGDISAAREFYEESLSITPHLFLSLRALEGLEDRAAYPSK